MNRPYSTNPETVRKRQWLRNRPQSEHARRHAVTRAYQSTFRGWLALKAGSLNTGVEKRRYIRGKLTASDLYGVWQRAGNAVEFEAHCVTCGAHLCGKGAIVFDHIKPLYFGGENSADNLQIMCRPCHLKKTADEVRRKTALRCDGFTEEDFQTRRTA